MKNLEQIRAAAAIGPAKALDKSAANKLPAMILTNGLLATAAFCLSESEGKNRGGMRATLEITAKHLEDQKHLGSGNGSVEGLIRDLSGKSSAQLQNATAEALALIGYLRRFAEKKTNPNEE